MHGTPSSGFENMHNIEEVDNTVRSLKKVLLKNWGNSNESNPAWFTDLITNWINQLIAWKDHSALTSNSGESPNSKRSKLAKYFSSDEEEVPLKRNTAKGVKKSGAVPEKRSSRFAGRVNYKE